MRENAPLPMPAVPPENSPRRGPSLPAATSKAARPAARSTPKRRKPGPAKAKGPVSVSPVLAGMTPIGWMICAASAGLMLIGSANVAVCEVRSGSSTLCKEEWSDLKADMRTAGLGIGGLLAQSPLAHLMGDWNRKRDEEET